MSDFSQTHMGPRKFLDERRRELAAMSFDGFEIEPQSPTIGAVVRGVDLAKPLDDAVLRELQRAFHAFKVLFFRDQELDVAQQLDFAKCFGPLEEHPFLPSKDGHAEVIRFEKDEETVGVENTWHSDVSWREVPSLGSVLHASEVPEIGGDTLWADMEAAYDGLPEDMKQRVEGLRAVHDFANSFGLMMSPEKREAMRAQYPPAEHPVIRTHPETGRRSIYVNTVFTSHVLGVEPEESAQLIRFLCRQAQYPEYQVRFRWEPGSVAFWDNRSTQHYAASDYWPQRRVMERVTVIGDRPS